MFLCFHPFRNHFPAKVVRERDDDPDYFEVLGTPAHPADKRLVNLQRGDRKALQVTQGRIACAEVVHVGFNIESSELKQGGGGRFSVLHEDSFRDLEPQTARLQAGLG